MSFSYDPRRTFDGPSLTPKQVRGFVRVVAVDPGLQGTGIAVFDRDDLIAAQVLKTPSAMAKLAWPTRADYLATKVSECTDWDQHTIVLCEMPEFQAGAGRAMGWKTGDLQRLAYFVGLIAGAVHPARFCPVEVRRWKGQLPKRVVEDRIRQRLGETKCRKVGIESHAWDAVGIGLWGLGAF